jgi:preprotein translocase subunit SecG
MLLFALHWTHYAFMIPLALTSLFLILIILVQRGRGGGLTGALGGMGGASAFGTKAGDLFTKVTIAVAFIWIVLSMASLKVLNMSPFDTTARGTASQPNAETKTGETKGGEASTTPAKSGGSATTPAAGGTPKSPPSPSSTPAKSTPAKSTPAKSTPAPSGETGEPASSTPE